MALTTHSTKVRQRSKAVCVDKAAAESSDNLLAHGGPDGWKIGDLETLSAVWFHRDATDFSPFRHAFTRPLKGRPRSADHPG